MNYLIFASAKGRVIAKLIRLIVRYLSDGNPIAWVILIGIVVLCVGFFLTGMIRSSREKEFIHEVCRIMKRKHSITLRQDVDDYNILIYKDSLIRLEKLIENMDTPLNTEKNLAKTTAFIMDIIQKT